jgi:hypothetical protein
MERDAKNRGKRIRERRNLGVTGGIGEENKKRGICDCLVNVLSKSADFTSLLSIYVPSSLWIENGCVNVPDAISNKGHVLTVEKDCA